MLSFFLEIELLYFYSRFAYLIYAWFASAAEFESTAFA